MNIPDLKYSRDKTLINTSKVNIKGGYPRARALELIEKLLKS